MNRIKEHYILAAAIATTFAALVVSATDIPRHALYLMEMTPDKFVHPQPDPEGQWVLYDNVQPAIDAAVAEALANCGGAGATGPWTLETATEKTKLASTLTEKRHPNCGCIWKNLNASWKDGKHDRPSANRRRAALRG